MSDAPLAGTPRADGFSMPAEFAPHSGCWMLWPERPDVWREGARPAHRSFAEVAAAIARCEPLTVGVSKRQFDNARAMLPTAVRLWQCDYNDAWVRDSGPTVVLGPDGARRGVDWDFNAWGGLYSDFEADRQLAAALLAVEGMDRYRAPLVMEGGSFHSDGEGTLLVTAQCLLNPNRNPHLSKAQIEGHLKDYLGVEAVIWLPEGVYQDETDGHVDNLCCFVRPGVVALTWTEDRDDPQYHISRNALAVLENSRDALGRPFEVHPIHQPGPLYYTPEEGAGILPLEGSHQRLDGQRLAASYVNFYLANGAVIAPLFDDPHDGPAMETLGRLFPEREVVGIYSREILLGGGNIHCITQQVPSGRAS